MEKLVLVDVGGAGGLQAKWQPHRDKILPVLFEPNPEEAVRLREALTTEGDVKVIEAGLFNSTGLQTLHIARYWGCTSIRKPNWEVLNKYQFTEIFETVQTVQIDCIRYDALYQGGAVPKPDVIKIDVQGCEYEVLEGFGHLLDTCIGIELETHFYPIYEGQKLLHDIVELLGRHGLVLRRLNRVPHFDNAFVEGDAFFTCERRAVSSLPPAQLDKFRLLQDVWELPPY